MYVKKNFSLIGILTFSGWHLVWLTAWASAVAGLHEIAGSNWLNIPWLPLSIVATAVAFYIGFKNNSAYARLWEARKIWGGIVNDSRKWGVNVNNYISTLFTDLNVPDSELKQLKKTLIYRHIGWLYVLRNQLLQPTTWEHISQSKHIKQITEKRINAFGVKARTDTEMQEVLGEFIDSEEAISILKFKNSATQIISRQSLELQELRSKHLIDDFRHMELQNNLNTFYDHQGKAERIKKFPFPRQYGSMSFVFVGILIFLLPFGLISEFSKLGEYGIWISIPFTVLVGWIYLMMELVGDYSENPFEGLGNDIPMLSLCRTIEIDLREMLGETELPPVIEAKNGVLM